MILQKNLVSMNPGGGYCAYHLAHQKILTDSKAHSGITAAKLFQEAAAAKFLGPFPHIYRLAALEKNESRSERELERAFENAVEAMKHLPVSKPLEDDEGCINNYKNMFRLAAYYFSYPVEGTSIVPPLIGDPSWILVGNDPKLAKQKLSKAFILEEIESLCKEYPEAVFFKLSKKNLYGDDEDDELERQWQLGSRPGKRVKDYPALRLLAYLLRGAPDTTEGLKARLNATSNNFSKIKERLKNGLSDLLQPDEDIFVSQRGKFPHINPDIVFFGAVELLALTA